MQVVIVGAGPAGLSAAVAAREAGATVRLLDAADATGGQYWRHLPEDRPAARERLLHHGWNDFLALRNRLENDPGVQIDVGAHVWSLSPTEGGVQLDIIHGDSDGTGRNTERLTPDALILATGAHDRALPIPGWTLPGVFTAGAAQALAKSERVAVGGQVVVAGAGPFLLPVTTAVGQAGGRVVAVIEAGSATHLGRSWLRRPWQLIRAGGKVGELLGYVRHHVRHQIPYRTGRAVIAIHGQDRVESVTVARIDKTWQPVAGTEELVACDAVCLGHGFVPRLELAVAAGCRLDQQRFVDVDADQRTSITAVLAAGELTGIGGSDLSQAEGRIAGWIAAGGNAGDSRIFAARRERATYRRFADRLEAAHGIGAGWPKWLDHSTLVCRCEEVDVATLRRVASSTAPVGLRSIKLTTRAGLGACQGRVCGRNIECLLADQMATDRSGASAGFDRRPVALPIRLGELAAMHGEPTTPTSAPTSTAPPSP